MSEDPKQPNQASNEFVLSSERSIPPDFARIKDFIATHLDQDAVTREQVDWVDDDLFTERMLREDYDLSQPITLEDHSFSVMRIIYETQTGRGNTTEIAFTIFLSNRNQENKLTIYPSASIGWHHGALSQEVRWLSLSADEGSKRFEVSEVNRIMDELDTVPMKVNNISLEISQ